MDNVIAAILGIFALFVNQLWKLQVLFFHLFIHQIIYYTLL